MKTVIIDHDLGSSFSESLPGMLANKSPCAPARVCLSFLFDISVSNGVTHGACLDISVTS
jgi:hypothetical protein